MQPGPESKPMEGTEGTSFRPDAACLIGVIGRDSRARDDARKLRGRASHRGANAVSYVEPPFRSGRRPQNGRRDVEHPG